MPDGSPGRSRRSAEVGEQRLCRGQSGIRDTPRNIGRTGGHQGERGSDQQAGPNQAPPAEDHRGHAHLHHDQQDGVTPRGIVIRAASAN